jgi:hypothetical protein
MSSSMCSGCVASAVAETQASFALCDRVKALPYCGAGLAGVLETVIDISRSRCTALFFEFFEQCFRHCAGHAGVFKLGNSHFFDCCQVRSS